MNRSRWIILLIVVLWSSCVYDNINEIPNHCAGVNLVLTVAVSNATTCGASDGSLTISATGGVKDYNFSINDAPYQPDSVYHNLIAGSYTVSVKDGKGCTSSQIASVNNNQSPLKISTSSTANSGCATPNGTITIAVTGGKNPILYKVNSGGFQSGNTFTGLTAGSYSVTAIDSTTCTISSTVVVASDGPSFSSDISPIISTNCATGGCHSGNRSPNLSSYAAISANASSIVSAINNTMPPGGRLTEAQIGLITCWAKDGAPNN